jgi:hypothetical protein
MLERQSFRFEAIALQNFFARRDKPGMDEQRRSGKMTG